jgi:hypothetical protein
MNNFSSWEFLKDEQQAFQAAAVRWITRRDQNAGLSIN